jgi:hypothetical protein
MPEWLDQGIGGEVEDREEQDEIAAGFERLRLVAVRQEALSCSVWEAEQRS